MAITIKTHKILWGRAANRCAFENCQIELTEATADSDDHYTVGDEAHIISSRAEGPRYQKDYSPDDIDKYDNLLLLCKNHHKTIDSDVNFYPVEKVRKIKRDHELWVTNNLNPDKVQQKDDELFADYIDKIEKLASFDTWHDWTQHFQGNGAFPRIKRENYDQLVELHKYISGRIHPTSRKDLLKAILQFNTVLEDFVNEFHVFMSSDDPDYYITQQLYRTKAITIERQQIHEQMLEELIIELTKAGNYLCDIVRGTFYTKFRITNGILLLYDYPIAGIAYRRFEYAGSKKYPGFVKIRERAQKRLNMI